MLAIWEQRREDEAGEAAEVKGHLCCSQGRTTPIVLALDASIVFNVDLIAMLRRRSIFWSGGSCINLGPFIMETACQVEIHFQQKAEWRSAGQIVQS